MGIISPYVHMTPEQRAKRKEEWRERQIVFGEGRDPDKEKAQDRAFKALRLLKDHVEGTIKLSEVEKVALAGIVVERSIDDFHFFTKHVLNMDLLTDITHKRWCEDHQKSIKLSKKRVMRLKSRGTYKSTIYGIGTILWLWGCFSPQLRIFYTSANALLLQEVSDKLNQYIGSEKSETLYSTIFGITKDGTAKNTSDVINVKGRSGKGFSLILRTAGGSSVGIHPNVIIVDDPCFVAETPVLTDKGYVNISDIKPGDMVLTSKGFRRVEWSGKTGSNKIVFDFNINGNVLTCTKNHGIITQNRGKVKVCNLLETDYISKFEEGEWKSEKLELQKLWSLTELNIEDIQSPKKELTGNIFGLVEMLIKRLEVYIGQFGFLIKEKFKRVNISTTKIITTVTIQLKTWNWLLERNIIQNIQKNFLQLKSFVTGTKNILKKLVRKLLLGIVPQKVLKKAKKFMKNQNWLKKYVKCVVENLQQKFYLKRSRNTVLKNVDLNFTKRADVYNITVQEHHEFVANGILVANCDHNDRDSKTTRDSKESWFDSLTPLLVPFRDEKNQIEFESIYYIGTRWHMKDLVNHILERNEGLPDKQKWDVEIEAVCGDDGKSNYPDFISDEKIAEIRANISDVFFACQYQNNPLPDGMQVFDLKRLTFVREEQVDLRQGQMICVFDPSMGKSSSDYPIVWWIHYHDDFITCYDCIDKKVELSLIVHQMAAKNQLYGCRTMIFESNGVTLIEQSLRDAHERVGWKMQYTSLHHSSNKHERIVSIQPDLYSGRVRFMSDYTIRYPEAMSQIAFYPVYGYDDAPDCLEMAISHFRQKHFKFIRFEGCL
jgi:hypothetical protein